MWRGDVPNPDGTYGTWTWAAGTPDSSATPVATPAAKTPAAAEGAAAASADGAAQAYQQSYQQYPQAYPPAYGVHPFGYGQPYGGAICVPASRAGARARGAGLRCCWRGGVIHQLPDCLGPCRLRIPGLLRRLPSPTALRRSRMGHATTRCDLGLLSAGTTDLRPVARE